MIVLGIFLLFLIIILFILLFYCFSPLKTRWYGELRHLNIRNDAPFLMRCNGELSSIPSSVMVEGISNGIIVKSPGFKILYDAVYHLETTLSVSCLDYDDTLNVVFMKNNEPISASSSTITEKITNLSLTTTVSAKTNEFIEIRVRGRFDLQVTFVHINFSIISL